MPTVLPRVQVTQTPEMARALELAAQEWPDVPRSELIVRLVTVGAAELDAARARRAAARREVLAATAGTIDYPDGYLAELRDEWPA